MSLGRPIQKLSIHIGARRGWLRAAALLAGTLCLGGTCAAQADPGEITPPAAPAPEIASLAVARKYVQTYFDNFSDLACKEAVTQIVLNDSGHAIYRENSAYDYQLISSTEAGNFKFTETRGSRNPAFRDPARTLLVTSGFSSLLLVAHPMYEASYTFEPAGSETIGGVAYDMIHFVSVPGGASPATLRLRGKNYPLPLTGTLWVDPKSGTIVKLDARVDSEMKDLGLAGLRSEIHYGPHTFKEPEEAVWVPESAVIDVDTPRQHWRNLHKFSDYKRFNVNVHEEIGTLP